MSRSIFVYQRVLEQSLDFSDHLAAFRLYEAAFCHPEILYRIFPMDVAVAKHWIQEHAFMGGFTYCAGVKSFERRLADGGLLHYEQKISLDELYYQGRCGWVASLEHLEEYENNGYLCDFPTELEDEHDHAERCRFTGKRLCHSYQCPIAMELDEEDGEEEEGWMSLSHRPRYAYVPNVQVIGCEQVLH